METDHLEDPGVDWRIILNWIFSKWDGGIYWIELAQNREGWRALVKAIMKLRVPQNEGNFLTSLKPISFSRKTLLLGIS